MTTMMRPATIATLLATLTLTAGCDKPAPKSELTENIEKTVGPPQESTGMLGGNSAPLVTDASTGQDAAAPAAPDGAAPASLDEDGD